MPLGKKSDAGDYVDDFKKSKAPQFKGKSQKKRKEMAIAAYLSSKNELTDIVREVVREAIEIDNTMTVLSVIDGKRNLDNDQIKQLFDDMPGTFYIHRHEEGEQSDKRKVSREEALKYVDYYNARLKGDTEKEEKLGAELKVLGFESELLFRIGEFNADLSVFSKNENYADGKVQGKSRPGRVKKAGASCKGSVSDLRAKAKKYGGEKGKMYHWCANMKSGRKNESSK